MITVDCIITRAENAVADLKARIEALQISLIGRVESR